MYTILTIFELIGMANTGVNCCWGSILHLLPTVHFENDDDRSLLDNFIFMLCQICQCYNYSKKLSQVQMWGNYNPTSPLDFYVFLKKI